ncbi:MAG: TonB family protein, partial [Deltaproteobacteria bacterium]|nr:TonB family protein [Deltaproteobacteria bacterium]
EKDRKMVMKSGLLAALSKMGASQQGAASNVLGPGGLGTGINNALGGVKGGAGQGDAYGVGGLGSRGTGGGGGGTALGIGGLGTGGDGHGKGGYGEVDLGGRGKDDTQFIPGKTTVVGGLSREVINRVIQRHYNEIKYCYEKELSKDPGLYGKVTVLFMIEGSGRVGDAQVQQTTMSSEPVESCMLNHVKRWVFPQPQGGGTVQVTYPYVFKASGQ